jgi:hypothetical protein
LKDTFTSSFPMTHIMVGVKANATTSPLCQQPQLDCHSF